MACSPEADECETRTEGGFQTGPTAGIAAGAAAALALAAAAGGSSSESDGNGYTAAPQGGESGDGALDSTAPVAVSLLIDNGAASTNTIAVTLEMSATDDVAVTHYYASESTATPQASDSNWQSYQQSTSFTLSGSNSLGVFQRTVYVWFKDAAGNVSESVGASISLGVYDTTVPAAVSVVIEGGTDSTKSSSVTLTFSATDDQAVTGYYASESTVTPQAGDSGWDNYSTSVSYSFDNDTAETKTVNVWFKDAAGNVSGSVADTIELLVAASATGTVEWTQQLGTSFSDRASGIATDSSGNVYVTGTTDGTLDGGNVGSYDLILVKYNSAGVKQWTRQLGTSEWDEAQGIATDSSGNVYVTGYTKGALDGSNAGWSDLFVVKYDSGGAKQWTKQLGTDGNDWAFGIATDSSGNVYVTGYTNGALDGSNAGGEDLFVVKYDSAGAKQWTRQLGTFSRDAAYDIATDSSGNVYVTGYTNGALDDNTSAGSMDLFVVKYDSAGAKQWTRQLGISSDDWAFGIATDSSGNVYVTGETFGGLDGNINAGGSSVGSHPWSVGSDLFVVKYDSGGAKQWTKQLGTSDWERATGIATDSSGNVYVTGWTNGALDGSNAGGEDLFVVKYDSAGAKQWIQQFGTSNGDYAVGITADSEGNVYLTGSTAGSLGRSGNAGGDDIFVMKLKKD